MTEQTTEAAIAEIWQLFRETDAKFKETDAKFKETDAKFKETDAKFKETDAKFKETDERLNQRFAETDARLNQRFAETDAQLNQRFAETDRQIKETGAQLRRLEGLFGNQWGRLIEALVQPGVLKLFQRRGYNVRRLHQRSKAQRNGDNMEIDLILEDEDVVVTVEVKSTMTVEWVNDFLADLAHFTEFFPKYRGYRLFGAVAGLEISADVEKYAWRQGLFVLRVSGNDLVELTNSEHFTPQDFGRAV